MMVSKWERRDFAPCMRARPLFDKRIIGPFSRYYYYYYHHRRRREEDKKKNAFAGSSTTTSSLIEVIHAEVIKAVTNADAAKRNVETAVGVGLRCDKEGYFIVGLKMLDNTPAGRKRIGTCAAVESEVLSTSAFQGVRSTRRRDDSREDERDADFEETLNKDETDVRVLSENCERGSLGVVVGTPAARKVVTATDKSLRRASSSNAISALSNNEAKCPSGVFRDGIRTRRRGQSSVHRGHRRRFILPDWRANVLQTDDFEDGRCEVFVAIVLAERMRTATAAIEATHPTITTTKIKTKAIRPPVLSFLVRKINS